MRYCDQCGKQVPESAKFCEQCGVKLPESTVTSPSTPIPEVKIDVIKEEAPEQPDEHTQDQAPPREASATGGEIEELDLTNLDKTTIEQPRGGVQPTPESDQAPGKKAGNIINLQDVLESEEKVEADDSIKREVLADDEELTKVCPMCGEDLQINKKLLENAPVLVKCLKCGNNTKIW